MITIKKEMIKVSESKNFLNDDCDGFIFGLTDLTVYIKEIDRFIDVDIYSSIKIDQQEIIKKMQNLNGLKFKMLPTLLRNHTYTEKRTCFFEVNEEGLEFDKDDIKFNDEVIKFLEQIREGTDELLKEVIEEQIKNHFEIN